MHSMVEISHEFLKPVLHPQAVCVDGTFGTGKDSVFFLNQKVKKVIAFEIQKEAIDACTITDPRFILNPAGHENMDEYIQEEIDAIIFNFGYCPGLDPLISTKWQTSCTAVKKGLSLLKQKGRMALVLYPHEQGRIEAEKIESMLSELDAYKYSILKMNLLNQDKSPYIIGIEKREK